MRKESGHSTRRTSHEQAETYFKKGKELQEKGKCLEAMEAYLKATICDTGYFQAHCNMGACFKSLGKYPEARSSYQRAIDLCPDDTISHYNLANLERLIGDYDQSNSHYKIVIRQHEVQGKDIGSLYLNSLVNLGISYKNEGHLEKAVVIYEQVNNLAPQDSSGYFNHAMCLTTLIEFSPANATVNRERAMKVTALLDQVQLLAPGNRMVELTRLKLSVLMALTNHRTA